MPSESSVLPTKGVTTPHFSFPFQFSTAGAVTVEQDSDDEIANCVVLALMTPVGSRFYVPEFGIDDPTFTTNRQSMLGQLQLSEPRAQLVLIEKVLDSLEDDITVGVGNIG